MAEKLRIFYMDQFVLFFQQYSHHNIVLINEGLKIQRIMKDLLLRFDEINGQILSYVENLDLYGFQNSEGSGSSGDSGIAINYTF